jgi:RimJ/RimL family protein N-acetyltransferase
VDSDAAALVALHTDPLVMRFWDAPAWESPDRAETFIRTCRTIAEEETGARVAIERRSDGTFIGWCGLTRWNHVFRSASLGYCFAESAWRQGFATEAARALLTWGFATFNLHRVQAEADTRNAASAHVLEKLGFTLEGTLREDCIVNGEISDSWVFGLLAREWSMS